MTHHNRSQIRLPRRVVDELCTALESCLAEMARWNEMEDNSEATRQALEFGRRTLSFARKRVAQAREESNHE